MLYIAIVWALRNGRGHTGNTIYLLNYGLKPFTLVLADPIFLLPWRSAGWSPNVMRFTVFLAGAFHSEYGIGIYLAMAFCSTPRTNVPRYSGSFIVQ